MRISIALPTMNEVENVEALTTEIFAAMRATPYEFEVIFVDDGSTDGTLAKLHEVSKRYPITVIELSRNFGQTAAMSAGVDHASGEIIVFLDADRQNDPADIPKLIAKLEEGYDVVSGWRRRRRDAFFSRTLPSRIVNWVVVKITGVKLHDSGCSLKAYRAYIFDQFRLYGEMHRLLPAYALQYGARIAEVEVNHRERTAGESKYGMSRIFRVVLDLMTAHFFMRYRSKPMHFFGGAGFVFGLLCAGAGLWAIALKVFSDVSFVSTPLPLMTTLFFSMTVLCVFFGVTAELLVRTYFESQDRRVYWVRQVVVGDADPSKEEDPAFAASVGKTG